MTLGGSPRSRRGPSGAVGGSAPRCPSRWVTGIAPAGMTVRVKRCECGHVLNWEYRRPVRDNPQYYPPHLTDWENEGGAL